MLQQVCVDRSKAAFMLLFPFVCSFSLQGSIVSSCHYVVPLHLLLPLLPACVLDVYYL